jgi:hypothetical protein
MLRRRVLIVLLAAMTAACETLTVTDECRIFSSIRGSKADTAGTRRQVDIHNSKGVEACGWQP